MHNRRRVKRAKAGKPRDYAATPAADRPGGRDPGPEAKLIMAAALSRRLGITAVTLWRWRNNKALGFPKGRRINDRVYFPWHEVAAWLERQQQTA
jgi:predicted DNA-binding transcriptional regulator AlpA